MRFKKVAVLKGGVSSEREVSLKSGSAVAEGLRAAGYETAEVDVRARVFDLPAGVEAVFVALHGEFGEDGGVQEFLSAKGVPYTGAGPESSRMAFDKILAKKRFVERGIPTPEFQTPETPAGISLPLPVVVKPARQGSSIGVKVAREQRDLAPAFAAAAEFKEGVLVETFIPGRELTSGIVGRQVLPAVEIVAQDGQYDYAAKYLTGKTGYLVPAPLSVAQAETCGRLARAVFDALECRAFGRVDMRMNPDGEIFVLELNTIPGFTQTSLLPKAARAAGIAFPDLCASIMEMADL